MLMAHRALTGKKIARPWQYHPLRRRNPNALDVAGSAINLAVIGGVALVGYKLATGPLAGVLKTIGIDLGSGGGDTSGGTNNPGERACYQPPSSRARLTFSVSPWNPQAVAGAAVAYSGTVTAAGLTGEQRSVKGAKVAFWDQDKCQPFAYVWTDDSGNFYLSRPLQADETGGYGVFAYYDGSSGQSFPEPNWGEAVSGVIRVVPQ